MLSAEALQALDDLRYKVSRDHWADVPRYLKRLYRSLGVEWEPGWFEDEDDE